MFNKIYESIKKYIVSNYKFLIFIAILLVLFWVPTPYVIYSPGGGIDLGKRIVIEDSYDVDGKLQMAYVTMSKGNLVNLAIAKILPNWDIVKKEEVTYENESLNDSIKADKIEMDAAIDNAVITAYKLAGEEVKITDTHNIITYLASEADTTLHLLDEVVKVNGQEITSLDDCKKIVTSQKENAVVNFDIVRNKKNKNATAKVYNTEYGLKIGVAFTTTYDYKTGKDIKIKSKSSEYGPSGGAMMALSIYNYLTDEDVTKGLNIFGTGTIDQEGNIGEIGGVKYKILGAIKNDADVFIVPEENYEEAKKVAKKENCDIIIIADKTLSGVIEKLKNL